jgi:hypothetical protein
LSNASQEARTIRLTWGAVAGEQLDERATGVVADDRDVAEVEAVDELGDETCDPAQRQVGVGVHRVAVCPSGSVGATHL